MRKLIIFSLFLSWQSFAALVDPTTIFPKTKNSLEPSIYWLSNKKPYPTNAWFINFVLKQPSDPVNILPYLVQSNHQGLSLGYTAPVYYAEPEYPTITSAFFYQFENQMTIGTIEPITHYGVASFHGLWVNLAWWNDKSQSFNAPIFQGSPYLSVFFNKTSPQFSSPFKWLSINQRTNRGFLAPTKRYEIVLAMDTNQTQTWLLYSDKPIIFNWTTGPHGEKLEATAPYSGWLRLVLQKDSARGINNEVAMLDTYSQTIPLDYEQSYAIGDKKISYSLHWKTQNNKAPLMLSLPHQRNHLLENSPISYASIKGPLQGETKSEWKIERPKIPLQFLEPKNLDAEQTKIIRDSLFKESEIFLHQPFSDAGPYREGKRYAHAARLILIANKLREFRFQEQLLAYIELELTKKMLGKTKWWFEYDTTWGGIIPSIDDYGTRHYNDHHFHYGYWVYTFAVIAKFDPDWLTRTLPDANFTPKDWVSALINDYASNTRQTYFPLQRYQDDYAGHSWASGLSSFKDGQNEQSSSEAVNAYYAIALYAEGIHDEALLHWAQFLMSRELVSAQTYWQIQKSNPIYNEKFTKANQVVANLWGSKVDANAFFKQCKSKYRCGLEYSFGIEMLPFTAISIHLFDKEWLHNAYPTIKKLLAGDYGAIEPSWQWILIKGVSLIMDKNEKKYFFNRAMNSNPEDYDYGDSKTNTLYFLSND